MSLSTKITLRKATHADLQDLVAFCATIALDREPNDPAGDFGRIMGLSTACTWIAHAPGGRIAGTITASYEGRRGWVMYFGIAEPYRGGQLADELMTAAVSFLSEIGAPKILLLVRNSDASLINYYRERHGFSVEEVTVMGLWIDPDRRMQSPQDR